MKWKILVVGINPSNYSTKSKNRKNHTFDRLEKWCDYIEVKNFSFINCISVNGDYKKKNVDYDSLREVVYKYEKVIALGNFVSEVLKDLSVDHFRLPHPSPRNRLLNSREYELNILNNCRLYLEN